MTRIETKQKLKLLLEKTDGREDDNVLDYAIATEDINNLAGGKDIKTVIYGLKGVGKSTAFKYLVSNNANTEKSIIVGFSPGETQVTDLVPSTSGDYRERLYNVLLMNVLSLAKEKKAFPVSRYDKFKTEIEDLVGPLEDYLLEVRKRLKGVAGFKFDLSQDQEAKIRGFDRDKANNLLKDVATEGWKFHFVFDDPEMSLGGQGVGYDALAGLIQAANQINTNVGDVFQVTILLKSHLKPLFAGYEEVSNILPSRIGFLSWDAESLASALSERIKVSGADKEDLLSEFDRTFNEYIYPRLRNGPRDLFAWLSLAYGKNGMKPLNKNDLNSVVSSVAKYSLDQITTGYQTILPDISALITEIFSSLDWLTYDDLKAIIVDKRANSPEMQSIDKSNSLDTSQKYIAFLAESGCLQMKDEKVLVSPFQRQYAEYLGTLRTMQFRLHPLLAHHPEISLSS